MVGVSRANGFSSPRKLASKGAARVRTASLHISNANSFSILLTMDNNNFKRNKSASERAYDSKKSKPVNKAGGKAKRTNGGRGLGLMKRSNDGFGRGGKHKFAGKLRIRSPPYKPMRLSWKMSKKILRGSPQSPIQAFTIDFTPQRKRGELKEYSSDQEDKN